MTSHQSSNIAPARTRSAPNTAMRHAHSAATDPHDLRLRDRLLARLEHLALCWFGIEVHVDHGLVRLCGQIRDPRLRAHAEWLAFTTDGVSAVCSDWHVAPITRKPQRH